MKNLGGIKIIMIATLALMIFAGTGAATSPSNSDGGSWHYHEKNQIVEQ